MMMKAVRSSTAHSSSSTSKRRCLGTDVAGTKLLEPFQTFGWQPNEALSADDNFMDLTLILTRSSQLKQGGMACILVRSASTTDDDHPQESLLKRILSVSTNQSLFREGDSDIHAEISALGQAAKSGLATADCTAYITMPPCKTCFGALFSAGVKRIVSRHSPRQAWMQQAAEQHGMQVLGIADAQQQRARVDEIVKRYNDESMAGDAAAGETR